MKYELEVDIQYHKQSGRQPAGVAVVYISNDRPFGNGGTIIEDFAWRRTVTLAEYKNDPEFLPFVLECLPELGYKASELRVSFSRYAGCGMCPCSPGLVIKHKTNYVNHRSRVPNVWLKVIPDNQLLLTYTPEIVPMESVWY